MIGSRLTLGATTPDPTDLAAVEVEMQDYAAPVRPSPLPKRVIRPREKKARSGSPVGTEHYFDTADGQFKPKRQPEPERRIAPQRYVEPSYFQYTPDYHD